MTGLTPFPLGTDLYESDAPTTHTRVEMDTWPLECIYGECEHATEADENAERPLPQCPKSKEIVCDECSTQNAEYEGGVQPWPCENKAVQEWQADGGPERQLEVIAEAFLRGWAEHDTRAGAQR